jgi:hypothetical protein
MAEKLYYGLRLTNDPAAAVGAAAGPLKDIYDGTVWRDIIGGLLRQHPNSCPIGLGSSWDGININNDLSASESQTIWPFLLTIQNIAPWMRLKSDYMWLTIVPPVDIKKQNLSFCLTPLLSDLRDLYTDGMSVFDAYVGKTVFVKAALLFTVADLRGMPYLTSTSSAGAYHACHLCSHRALQLSEGGHSKMAYGGCEETGIPRPRSSVDFQANIFLKYLPYWDVRYHCFDWMHTGT